MTDKATLILPALRTVINSLPALREAIKLSVDEIHTKYKEEKNWLTISEG